MWPKNLSLRNCLTGNRIRSNCARTVTDPNQARDHPEMPLGYKRSVCNNGVASECTKPSHSQSLEILSQTSIRKEFRSESDIFVMSFAKSLAITSELNRSASFAAFSLRVGLKFTSEFSGCVRIRSRIRSCIAVTSENPPSQRPSPRQISLSGALGPVAPIHLPRPCLFTGALGCPASVPKILLSLLWRRLKQQSG